MRVVPFPGITRLEIQVDQILEQARTMDLTSVVVLGWKPDGEPYFALSMPDGGDALWLMRMAEHAMLKTSLEIWEKNRHD